MWIRLRRKIIQKQFKKDLETFHREEQELQKTEIELSKRMREAQEAWEKGELGEYLKKIMEEPPLPIGIKRRG